MLKIPVGRTIAFAYRFLFVHIGTVLAIGWFPAVLYAAAAYGSRAYEMAHRTEIAGGDPQAMWVNTALTVIAIVVTLFATSLAGIGITRQALGGHAGPPPFPARIGAAEWRMFAANIRYSIGAIVLLLLASAISTVAFALSGLPLNAPQAIRPTPAVLLAALISWFVFIYAFVTILRMGFLLAPVVAAEERAGLKRAHDLIHRNIWRMVGVLIVLWLPAIVLFATGLAGILRASIGVPIPAIGPDQMAQKIEDAIEANLVPWTIFTAIILLLWWGIFYAGAAYAYRALVPDERNGKEK